jgi:hypothetical protein
MTFFYIEKREVCVFMGGASISQAMMQLPKSFHIPECFRIDCWYQNEPALLFVSLHGFFIQKLDKVVRAFDRTLVLSPAPPTSS